MSECEELVKRLRAKKKATGFKSGLSEDGGHRVAEMQYVPDPDAQEAATLIATLAAEKEALEARVRELEGALRPFAMDMPDDLADADVGTFAISAQCVRAARAALTREEGKG
jgi:hypothetical protein